MPSGPSVEADLRWDTASEFSINMETPWDILRAQILWAIWSQRLSHAFNDERFHLGLVLWYAWRNTIYAAMEAFKELHRHKRNEERRQEQIACFKQVWTTANLFGRSEGDDIKWHLTPPQEFLPQELGHGWSHPSGFTGHRLRPTLKRNSLPNTTSQELLTTSSRKLATISLLRKKGHRMGDNHKGRPLLPRKGQKEGRRRGTGTQGSHPVVNRNKPTAKCRGMALTGELKELREVPRSRSRRSKANTTRRNNRPPGSRPPAKNRRTPTTRRWISNNGPPGSRPPAEVISHKETKTITNSAPRSTRPPTPTVTA